MILKKVFGLAGMCLMLGVIGAQAATLTVTTTADAGAGSLRQALIDANINAEANIVTFNIPTSDPGFAAANNRFTINLVNPLPDLPSVPIVIDNTQSQAITVSGNNTFRIFTLVDSAVVTVNNLTVSNGYSSGLGGGFFLSNSSTLNLNRSTVSGNAANNGGAIYINNSGTLNLDQSTISGNTAFTDGGGIFNNTSGTINATSNTFDGNSAAGKGGGVYNTATITFTSNTISSNSATDAGGGIYNNFTATLNNNLVALNTASDGNDLLGRGTRGIGYTGSYNLIGNIDGSEGLAGGTNRSGSTANLLDPLLGLLQNNGGKTFTRSLLLNSPAIDKGNSPAIITDQRGLLRPYDNPAISNDGGNGSDIGAFEVQFPAAPTAGSVTVGGRILTASGRSISRARITMTDFNGIIRTAITSIFGYYRFRDVETGETYVISAKAKGYAFTQPTQVVNLTEETLDRDFIANSRGKAEFTERR